MCLAVPARVIDILEDGKVRVQVGNGATHMDISTLLLPETPKTNDYVIVHAGFALRTLDTAEAEETINIFKKIAELNPPMEETPPPSRDHAVPFQRS